MGRAVCEGSVGCVSGSQVGGGASTSAVGCLLYVCVHVRHCLRVCPGCQEVEPTYSSLGPACGTWHSRPQHRSPARYVVLHSYLRPTCSTGTTCVASQATSAHA
jgi:hypothetical protein